MPGIVKVKSEMKQVNKGWLAAFGLLLLLTVSAFGQSGTKYFFEQGNQAYRDGEYAAALEWYMKIPAAGYESSQVYYNIGNCHYKLGNIGPTVLFYEKAHKLAPNDSEIRENLTLANLRVVDHIEMPPKFFLFEWWDSFMVLFNIPDLTKIALFFYILLVGLLALLLFSRGTTWRRWVVYSVYSTLVLTVIASYLLIANIYDDRNTTEGIVLAKSLNVQSAPDAGSTDIFVLHEGAKVTLDETRGEWVKISLPDGKTGWMRQNLLGEI